MSSEHAPVLDVLEKDLIDSLPGHAALLDLEGRVRLAGASLLALAGDALDGKLTGRVEGMDIAGLCAALYGQYDPEALKQGLAGLIAMERDYFSLEMRCRTATVSTWHALTLCRRNGPRGGLTALFTDIGRQKQLEEHIQHDAFHDALTGLFNRALFLNRLSLAISRLKRNPKSSFAVLYLDIDRFKLVNKTFGHVTGDRLLMVAANRLLKLLRSVDTLARFGGDEFAILVDEVEDAAGASVVAERILNEISEPYRLKKQDVHITCSIGLVLGSTAYEHPDQILRDADNAMYFSKEHGGGHYTVFEAGMHIMTRKRLEIEMDLRNAVAAGQISLYYQPIVSLRNGEITGFEALCRWSHPKYGMIPPTEFIPVAEETGIIHELGAFVLERSCRKLKELTDKFPGAASFTMNINISGKQFKRPDFVDIVDRAIKDGGVEPERIKLELTESVLLEDADLALSAITRLKALGVKVVIDDFGTGYSSLSYIRRFPFDSLKVDRSFVGSMEDAAQSREIIKSIIALAHSLGLEVVAEGVEAQGHRDLLTGMSCEFAQGYLFSRPIPDEELDALLTAQSREDPAAPETESPS